MTEPSKKKKAVLSPAAKGLAGSFGGVAEACLLQPIDVIKTRIQLDKIGKYKSIIGTGQVDTHALFESAACIQISDDLREVTSCFPDPCFPAFQTVIKEEGVRSLWKGLTPFATHLTLKYALRMGSNSFYQNLLRSKDGSLTSGARMGAGFMAGAHIGEQAFSLPLHRCHDAFTHRYPPAPLAGITEALIIVTPFEVVKIRLQQQKGMAKEQLKYRGPIHGAFTILREEGIRGLWSGASPTMVRNGTNQMCL